MSGPGASTSSVQLNPDQPFIVARFFPTEEDENQYFEAGLASWLEGELDDEMIGWTRWPPPSKAATQLVKLQAPMDVTWPRFKVQVMRFYETFLKARTAVPRFVEDSNYETDSCLGPRKRRKPIRLNISSSSSEDECIPVRKVARSVPPPPPIFIGNSAKPATPPPTQSKTAKGKSAENIKSKVPRKGQGLTRQELKKQEQRELLERLAAARAAAAAKMKSPLKVGSPWKVTEMTDTSPEFKTKTPEKTSSAAQHDHDSFINACNFLDFEMLVEEEDIENPAEECQHTSPELTPTKQQTPRKVKSPPREKTPLQEKSKSPTFRRFADIPGDTSFYLSPASAKAVSGSSKGQPSQTEAKKTVAEGVKSVALKSAVDGRRKLFCVDKKTDTERLEALEAAVVSLEVLVRETSAKQDIILMNLGRIQRSLLPSEKRITMPSGMPPLPLKNEDDLKKFEDFLAANDANLAAVCDYLATFIRTSVVDPERKSAVSILKNLLNNSLAKQMNLEGGNHKIGFRSLTLYKAFQGTLQTAFKDSDLSIGDDALQKWLKDAKWRKQGQCSRTPGNASPSKKKKRSPSA